MLPPPPTSTLFPYTTLFRSAVRHAALAADPAAERNARQIAGEVVAPGMIDAAQPVLGVTALLQADEIATMGADRKSTRLNSSHSQISYAVFCLKKKNINACT